MRCSEETRKKISEAQKGKPRPYLLGRKVTWAHKIVETRRKNNSYVVSEETREKMRQSAKVRKMPPMSEAHKQKLRESNKKTWSNPEILKVHGDRAKAVWAKMPSEKRKMLIENIAKACRTPEKREKSRQTILRLRQDPEWIRKSNEGKKGRISSFKGKHHTVESRIKNSMTKKNSPTTPRGPKNPAYIDGKGTARKSARIVFSQTLEYRLFREAVYKRDNWTCVICNIRGVKLCVDHIKSYKYYPELRTEISNGRTLCLPCHKKTPNYGRKEEYAKVI